MFELGDRVSILRDGALIGTERVAETDEQRLIRDMSNRTIEQIYHKETIPFGATLVEVEGLSGRGFEDVSLSVRSGEIIGLYGLIGAGRSEFVQTLFGRFPKTAGTISWQGKQVEIRNAGDAIARGIALVPESRRDQGLCLNLGVGLNLNLAIYERLSRWLTIDRAAEARSADRQIADLRIVAASRGVRVASLSGGNQQKVVVGKWLARGAKLFIFDEPTVGVDVGTKARNLQGLRGTAEGRRRDHPDLVLPARSLRTQRHAARVPSRPAGRQPRAAAGRSGNHSRPGARRLTHPIMTAAR